LIDAGFAMEFAVKPGSSTDPIELSAEPDFALGGLDVHPSTREAIRDGVRHIVEPRVMQVLVALAHARGAVVSRDDLIRSCWKGRVVGEAAINGCISKLRALAEAGGSRPAFTVATIPRVGYRLEPTGGFDAAPPETISARSPAQAPRAPTLPAAPARSRWALASGFAAIVLAILIGGFLTWRRHPPIADVDAGKPSIAVLPFKNLSTEADAGFLADAIQDEILTRLAKIGSLRVISRTSASEAAKDPRPIAEMAARLGVANVLDGSVQREGDIVRVNVQLIRAATDDHLWAENYDRRLDDVLSVESEIAGSIATALAARITPSEGAELATKPTANPKAYELYLRAIVLSRVGGDGPFDEAIESLGQAVVADPKFALAWAMLARLQATSYFGDRDPAKHESARAALDHARSLAPDLAEVQLANAQYKHYVELDYDGAKRELEALHARWPGNVEILQSLAFTARRLGHWQEAVAYLREAAELDPLSKDNLGHIAWTLLFGHRPVESRAVITHMREIWPGDSTLVHCDVDLLQKVGDLDRADAELEHVPASADLHGETVLLRRAQYAYRRRFAEGLAWFEALGASAAVNDWEPAPRSMLALSIGDFRRWTGDLAGARQSYQAAADAVRDVEEFDAQAVTLAAIAYSALGDREAASRYVERLMSWPLAADPVNSALDKKCLVYAFALLGDRDAAIAALERVMKEPSDMTLAMLRLEPDFDLLRSDPRFDRLLAEGMHPLD
jgi:TolB-like protein/DNA-binding winged helix-turn-helix (wHTH) protein